MSPDTNRQVPPPTSRSSLFQSLLFYGLIAAVCAAVLGLTYVLFVAAPPPRKLMIATGGKDGSYYKFAQRYARLLEKDGITLEVRETKGSGENLQLLQDDNAGVAIAIVQGGVADEAAADTLVALGSLYREPLWVFYRVIREAGTDRVVDPEYDRLSQLAGKRLAIGPPGSGTRPVAEQLLRDNGITAAEATLLPLTGEKAANALVAGEVDAVFLVASISTSYVRELFGQPDVRLLSLVQQVAYDRRYDYLSPVTIPEGLIDLGKNVPARDIKLMAPTAMLVARKDLHPALVPLLLAAATQVHRKGDLIAGRDEFPTPAFTDLPVDEDARHYYKSGPPFFQRVLPFWLATLVDRLKVMVIPLVMVLMPLIRLAPPIAHWRNRRKIYRWYFLLRAVEEKIGHGITLPEVREELTTLQQIESQLPTLSVPLGYMGEFYNMRFHLKLVREELEKMLPREGGALAPVDGVGEAVS